MCDVNCACVRCTRSVEIYNEVVQDLLEPANTALDVREGRAQKTRKEERPHEFARSEGGR